MSLTREQVETLLRPINPRRVLKAQNQSHVAAFDVIAHLSRVFGFGGWSNDVVSLELVHEHISGEPPKARAWVTYRCMMRLTIFDADGNEVCHFEDAATGSAQNMPTVGDAHDFAVKNAVSYALKRCAKNLGDQFGLSLYNKGATSALVGKTLVMPEFDAEVQGVDVEEHAPAPQTLGNDERQEPDESSAGSGVSSAPSSPPTAPAAGPSAAGASSGHGSPDTGDGPTAGDGPSPADVVDRIRGLDEQMRADVKEYARSKGYKVTPANLTVQGAADLAAWLDRREQATS